MQPNSTVTREEYVVQYRYLGLVWLHSFSYSATERSDAIKGYRQSVIENPNKRFRIIHRVTTETEVAV